MLFIALILVVSSLILYALVFIKVLGREGFIEKKDVLFFVIAYLFDWLASISMGIQVGGIKYTVHSILGVFALIMMTVWLIIILNTMRNPALTFKKRARLKNIALVSFPFWCLTFLVGAASH